jgi:hypothetical protein
MIDRNQKIPIIGLDGGLRYIPAYLIPDLQKQGWILVTNPKRTYYQEYDRTSPHYKEQVITEEQSDILYVDVI